MSQYRFVGAAGGEIWDTPYVFKRFGQLAEIPDNIAEQAILGSGNPDHGFPLVPAAVFDSFQFTDAELKTYGNIAGHPTVPPEFAAKRDAVWKELKNVRISIQSAQKQEAK